MIDLARVFRRNSVPARMALAVVLLSLSGCAAFRPLDGIPARYVPDEIKSCTRSGKKTIDLSLLSQTQPDVYHLDAGDVLAVYIEGVIPKNNEFPPVNIPQQGEEGMPSLGYPIPVRQDGTISLPLLARPVTLRGLTLRQAEDSIRRAYTVDKKILQSGHERVWVILHKPRQTRVLVIRQEGVEVPASGMAGMVNLGALKRGTGRAVTLNAYKNDVLHALAETGGLPGLDAENTIYVIRNKRRGTPTAMPRAWTQAAPAHGGWNLPGLGSQGMAPPSMMPPAGWPPAMSPNANPVIAPQDATIISPDAPATEVAPQSRLPNKPASTGVPLTTLGFETDDLTKHVTPASFQTSNPSPPAPSLPHPTTHGLVPMTAPSQDWQTGLPPTLNGTNWPEASLDSWMGHSAAGDPTLANHSITKIPVRLAPGEQVQFTERDIILEDGDIVFIESRDTEIFYTGGLLGGGQYTLPRDYDLDVLGAIAIAQAGRQMSGAANRATGGISALNQDVTIGASQVIILRQMPNGTQVPIKVDLYRAVRHPEERVLIHPGDYLVLQYTPCQAVGAFFERHLLEGALFGVAAAQLNRP